MPLAYDLALLQNLPDLGLEFLIGELGLGPLDLWLQGYTFGAIPGCVDRGSSHPPDLKRRWRYLDLSA